MCSRNREWWIFTIRNFNFQPEPRKHVVPDVIEPDAEGKYPTVYIRVYGKHREWARRTAELVMRSRGYREEDIEEMLHPTRAHLRYEDEDGYRIMPGTKLFE